MTEKFTPFKRFIVLPLFNAVYSNWVRILTLRINPFRLRGTGSIPKEGGLVIVANHLADIDPFMIQYGCQRPIHFLAKHDLFEWKVIGPLLKFFEAIPIQRNTADRKAIRRAVELAKDGQIVAIFPEGELSQTGELQPLLPGVALIIRQADVPAICCRLDGTQQVMPYGRTRPQFCVGATLSARWSEPRKFNDASNEEVTAWMAANLKPE